MYFLEAPIVLPNVILQNLGHVKLDPRDAAECSQNSNQQTSSHYRATATLLPNNHLEDKL